MLRSLVSSILNRYIGYLVLYSCSKRVDKWQSSVGRSMLRPVKYSSVRLLLGCSQDYSNKCCWCACYRSQTSCVIPFLRETGSWTYRWTSSPIRRRRTWKGSFRFDLDSLLLLIYIILDKFAGRPHPVDELNGRLGQICNFAHSREWGNFRFDLKYVFITTSFADRRFLCYGYHCNGKVEKSGTCSHGEWQYASWQVYFHFNSNIILKHSDMDRIDGRLI